MNLLVGIIFFGFFAGMVAGYAVTWRLDWILLREHPRLHREWQLGMLWFVWWSPTIERRLRALGDVRITMLLDQMKMLSIYFMVLFGGLAILSWID